MRTVGPMSPGVMVRICDKKGNPLPNQSEKGIVHLKGDNVMLGYYKAPEKTKEVLSKDGWFNTGDLGRLTINGSLQLCGRMKDTIVLTGGENIEPEPIENKLIECDLINQVMVVGQDRKVLGALIVPDFENLEDFARKTGIAYNNLNELCKNPLILEEYKKEIKSKVNSHHGFRSYERITYFKLITKPFTPGQELTYSLKMKRDVISEQYEKVIEKLFA
jgi:long-chain acyl-CoA synthetase